MKKGIYKEASLGGVALTDIGQKVYESVKELDKNANIKFIRHKIPGTLYNWDIEISNDRLRIVLTSRRYFESWRDPYGPTGLAIKIVIRCNVNLFSKYIRILKIKFKEPPIDFERWDKFKKMFNIDKLEVMANWRVVEHS